MRIRTKLLVLLLAISLTPMIAGALFLRYSMLGLGRTLAAGTRQAQTEYASELLRQLVIDYGRVIQQDRQALEQAVRLQAREVERRLSLPPVGEPHLFFNADYAIPGRGPGDLQPSDRHFLTRPDGVRVPIDVSYGEQVYFVVAGVALQAVAQDMDRLATMPEAYAFARRARPDLVYWQYTSLECGFHTSYPGHGGYPPEYDPRTREWYVRARDRGDVTWLVMPEVSSRTVAQTVAMPVRRADGSFAGVTAIDVPFSSMFQQLRLPKQWAAKSQAMLVTLGAAGSAEPKAEILVSRDYERHGEDWQMPLEMQYLESDQPEQLQRMLREASGSLAPVVRMGYRSADSLWACGAAGPGQPFPVVVVPYAVVVAEAVEAERTVLARMGQALRVAGLLLVGVVAIAVLAAAVAARAVAGPVHQLAQAGEKLAGGDYKAKVDIQTRDELRELGEVFNTMGPRLLEHAKMKQSLELAMHIQQNLLPHEQPRVAGFDIYGKTEYCDETGGDYFDYVDLSRLGATTLGIVVGDVSGHGIPAALLMASARSAFRIHAQNNPGDPAAVVRALNETLVRDTTDESFMTLYYLLVDTKERLLHWTAAGHDPALLIRRATGEVEELGAPALPAGLFAEADYASSGPARLASGDVLVIGTDGIWEARDPGDSMYGRHRLKEELQVCQGYSAQATYDAIMASVRKFCAGRPAEDDVTLVVLRVL